MKKTIFISFLIFISIVSLGLSQPPPCPNDCPSVPWIGPFPWTLPDVCPGVTATVQFEYRYNTCTGQCEFRLVGPISFTATSWPPSGCTMISILHKLSISIIAAKLGLCSGGVPLTIEMYAATCWKWDGPLPGPGGGPMPSMIACTGVGCCKSTYQVIPIMGGVPPVVIGYDVHYLSSMVVAGGNTCDPLDPGCTFTCGDD